ncbi:hypothetical protein I79_015004 [Cricetulus griseus]|uniref:Uncharacterized protein n=1 Tax=Cricetulus griseus TaxID=10029 RepID=G3HVM6_CRIGR|nr:hypothetical protein I79_015004 [Cricetulus griseus]
MPCDLHLGSCFIPILQMRKLRSYRTGFVGHFSAALCCLPSLRIDLDQGHSRTCFAKKDR